jgi:hypothetical protein
MNLTIKSLIPEGWDTHRYCLVNDAGEIVCHRDRYRDALEMVRRLAELGPVVFRRERPAEIIYEGRAKSKLSILSACREMEQQEIRKPLPGAIYESLYGGA